MITAVSLFAGVGGFDLALERNDVKVVASVEIDKNAQEVLRRHFPDSTIFGDITGVTGEQLIAAGFIPKSGIITGGFPCQDLSVAGKRAGLGGERSGLFWQICRLLDETRAQNFILENVPGLLSSNNGRDMAVVIEALVKRGYRIAYRVLDAQHFGVPQRRRRVFIVGCLGDTGRSPEEILAIGQSRAGYLEASNSKRKEIAKAVTTGIGNSSSAGVTSFSPSSFADYTENKKVSATLRAGGGDLGGGSETLLLDGTRVNDVRVYEDGIAPTVISRYGTGGGNVPMIFSHTQGLDAQPSEENSPTLRTGGGGMAVAYSVREDAKANNFSATETNVALAVQALQPSPQSHHAQLFIAQMPVVRRLTPTECERLQGFPDGWTDGQADSNRYKQMGNAVAVPVVEWIINRMVEGIK